MGEKWGRGESGGDRDGERRERERKGREWGRQRWRRGERMGEGVWERKTGKEERQRKEERGRGKGEWWLAGEGRNMEESEYHKQVHYTCNCRTCMEHLHVITLYTTMYM